MIDSHCHLHYPYDGRGIDAIVADANAAGITDLVTIGVDLDHLEAIEKISDQFPRVVHTVGVHPHDTEACNTPGVDALGQLRSRAKHPKCRAIGEIGLDYFYEHSNREIQKDWLQKQLDLALELRLPVVIHARDGKPKMSADGRLLPGAEADLLDRLIPYAKRVNRGSTPFVGAIHCFTGTEPFARTCIEAGFLISFSGVLTFKNAEDLRGIARRLPLESLLIETDAPYLAPVPMRGKKCEPAMIVHTARVLAECKGVSLDEVDRVTSENARILFNLGS